MVPVADFAGTAFASGLEWPARHISGVECFPVAAAELASPGDDHLQKKYSKLSHFSVLILEDLSHCVVLQIGLLRFDVRFCCFG